jgi:hypothetical protein
VRPSRSAASVARTNAMLVSGTSITSALAESL